MSEEYNKEWISYRKQASHRFKRGFEGWGRGKMQGERAMSLGRWGAGRGGGVEGESEPCSSAQHSDICSNLSPGFYEPAQKKQSHGSV